MSVELFIGLLVISATATSIGIEIVKKLFDAFKWKYDSMVVAVIVSFIVGVAEVLVYALQGNLPLDWKMAVYSLCMGLVNVVGCTTGYDTVKAFIKALFGKE